MEKLKKKKGKNNLLSTPQTQLEVVKSEYRDRNNAPPTENYTFNSPYGSLYLLSTVGL